MHDTQIHYEITDVREIPPKLEWNPIQILSNPVSPVYTYADLLAVSNAMNERHDCAIIALAIVTSSTYTRIHELFVKAGRRHRCYSNDKHIHAVLNTCGYSTIDISRHYEGSSIRSIAPQLPAKGNFLIHSRKHITAIRDGVVEDWSNQRKLYVKGIFQVVPSSNLNPASPDFNPSLALTTPSSRPRTVVINYSQPTKAVHAIADILLQEFSSTNLKSLSYPQGFKSTSLPFANNRRAWSTFRAKVIAECVANRINKTTAAVQVTKWMASRGYNFKTMA